MRSKNRYRIMEDNEIISEEILEGLGISQPAYEEIQSIVGRMPTVDELSTLMAMWQSSGNRQGLLSWLKGQVHTVERHDYIENEAEPQSRDIREPRVKECVEIARSLFPAQLSPAPLSDEAVFRNRGDAVYMVGDVSELFVNSDYGRAYLHLVDNPVVMDDEAEQREYLTMILDALMNTESIFSVVAVGSGGLFGTLLRCCMPQRLGFDILCCREIRLDAFLFGEQGVRYVVSMDEPRENYFLQKLQEARVNCCFLGRTTKGRIVVDGTDFGDVGGYLTT